MKYYIVEGIPDGKYNAQSKARNDANKILQKSGYKPFNIPTKYGVQEKIYLKYKQYFSYKKNYKIWKEEISKLNKGDMIVIQYPLINTMLNFQNMMDYCNELGIITVILIHDLDSIRMSNMPRKIIEDKNVLNKAKYIIAHNQKMKDYLVNNLGNEAEKIFLLKIFDYLIDKPINDKNTNKNDPVVIAGNLSPEKAKYIIELKDVENTDFNLYGKGYNSNEKIKNIFYKGAFLPEEVPNALSGSFGLVWDGTSKNTCDGSYGNYLRYNNPHKTSLYLASKLPVIVWEESALSSFVIENKVGITIKNLDEIKQKIEKLSDEDYQEMVNNTKTISDDLHNGMYLTNVLKEIEGKMK